MGRPKPSVSVRPSTPDPEAWVKGGASGVSQAPDEHLPGVPQVFLEHLGDTSQVSARHLKPRAAPGSAALFARKRGAPKRRTNVYFRQEVFARLEAYCARTGDELSEFIDAAVARALDAKDRKR